MAAVLARRNLAVVATRTTRAHRHVRMQLGRRPRCVALVAGRAIGRGCHVVGILASGCATVVTAGAIGGRCERAVVGLGAFPLAGRTMATFTAGCGRQVIVVLATRNLAVVATRTARADRNIRMQLGRRPTGVALVASGAVGCGGDMVGTQAGGTAAVMAARAIGGRGEGAVIGLGTLPLAGGLVTTFARRRGGKMAAVLAAGNRAVVATRTARADRNIRMQLGRRPTGVTLVASGAVGCGGDVVGTQAGGAAAVVATGAAGGTGEGAMVRLGATPDGGRLMATFATSCGRQVGRGLGRRDETVMTACASRCDRHIGVELGRQPTAGRVFVTGGAIGAGADVVGILAGRLGAVVAAGAIGRRRET